MTRRVTLILAALPAAALAAAQVAPSDTAANDRAGDAARALSTRILSEADTARAVPDLFRLYELRDDVADVGVLASAFDAVAAAPRARAETRATALELRAQIAVAQGQLPEAQRITDKAAPVRAFSVIGPFENEGRAGFSTAYGPEIDGFVAGKRYPGKEHEVGWRELSPNTFPLGFVTLSRALSPDQNVTMYAATVIHSDRARAVVFHLGASGASKVWVSGRLAHQDPSLHPSRFDQSAFAARLSAGDNLVLLKIAHSSGDLGFSLRLCDANDQPLTSLAASARVPSSSMAVAVRGETPAKIPALPHIQNAIDELREIARKNPKDARAQEDLAILLAARRPDDEGDRLALHAMERASDAAPGDPEMELRLARYEDRDANRRRASLERALERAPGNVAVLNALSALRLEKNDGWGAVSLAQKAQENDPRSAEATLALARAYDAVGLTARSANIRLALVARNPRLPRAQRAAAAAHRRLGNAALAEADLRAALQLRFDDVEARADLTGLLLDRGDLAGALALLGDAVALDPAALGPRLRAADLLSQNGRKVEADKAYAETVDLAPDDPDVREALGRHRLRTGDETGALAAFTRSLSLRPQNPSLRELMRSMRPEEQYATPYLADAVALAKEPAAATSDDSEVLADVTVTRVFPNGLSSRTHQLVIRALTSRGVDQARYQSLSYSPDRQVVRVERARILRKDGTVVEARSEGERNVSEPWYAMYYDLRTRVVGFPQLEPGDALELVTRIDDSGSNFFADYFGDFAYLQGSARRHLSEYVLLGPPGRTFYVSASPLRSLVHTEGKLPDGGTFQRFVARNVPRLSAEPSMPGSSDLYAYVHVSTYADWDDVSRFYWGLVKDQLKVTDEIRAAAQEAVHSAGPDEMSRIRSVYDYVVSNTRYVALEFGIHSFKPYPVETILNRRFGDCKDKASLMHAMLESLGIDSRLVLVRTRRMGNLDRGPASLAVFDHAILYVPKYDLYLDGTAEFHGSRELPGDDRGADALVIEPDGKGAKLRRIPEGNTADNFDDTRVRVALQADGSASIDLTAKTRGPFTAELRRTFESPDERSRRAEEQLSRTAYPGVKITSVEVSDPHDIENAFMAKFRGRVTGYASISGAGLRFAPFGQQRSYVESYAQLSRRTLPERLPSAQLLTVGAEIELPSGWTAVLPEDTRESGPHGRYSLHYANEGGKVTARLEIELAGGEVTPQQYASFRSFLSRLDAAVARRIEASPRAQTASLRDEPRPRASQPGSQGITPASLRGSSPAAAVR
jgi:cellulose synthase operon protein C